MSLLSFTTLELCAGAGGQALGFEQAGFKHVALIEIDPSACQTLRLNRPNWNVIQADISAFSGLAYRGTDVITAGLPCPPFSIAGKQLGDKDERNLFPHALRIIGEVRPRAVVIENVRGILDDVFKDFRLSIQDGFAKLGYQTDWRLMNASDFGVPQLRPRTILIALDKEDCARFSWPQPFATRPQTVGQALFDLMSANGWIGAQRWKQIANEIAPTIVGGSKKHGGPDLGPTRSRLSWSKLGVDGRGIAGEPPFPDFDGVPRLTVRMVARLQGFPDDWIFAGPKTTAYRQIGNALPPAFGQAVANNLKEFLSLAPRLSLAG